MSSDLMLLGGSMVTLADNKIPPEDLHLAARVFNRLASSYPGHPWMVNACHATGMIDIKHGHIYSAKGYRLKISDLFSVSEEARQVDLAGGELLERARLARGAADVAANLNSKGYDE